SGAGHPGSPGPDSTVSGVVRHGKSPGSWKTVAPRRGSGPAAGRPSAAARPSSAATSPPRMPSSVDLPHPDGPISVQNSPVPTDSETSRSASTGPDEVT